MNLSCKVHRAPEIAWRVIEDEAVIIDPRNGLVYPFNEVATFCWQACDGKLSIADIINKAFEEFEVSLEQIEKDLVEFFSELIRQNLILSDD